jgi:hypothetical protein
MRYTIVDTFLLWIPSRTGTQAYTARFLGRCLLVRRRPIANSHSMRSVSSCAARLKLWKQCTNSFDYRKVAQSCRSSIGDPTGQSQSYPKVSNTPKDTELDGSRANKWTQEKRESWRIDMRARQVAAIGHESYTPTGPRGDLTVKASPARVGHVKRRQAGLNRETQEREETHTAGGAWVMCYDWLAVSTSSICGVRYTSHLSSSSRNPRGMIVD